MLGVGPVFLAVSLTAFLVVTVQCFTPKSECLFQHQRGGEEEEDEYEHEEESRGMAEYHHGKTSPDEEDIRERMGLDEEEEDGPRGHAHGHGGDGGLPHLVRAPAGVHRGQGYIDEEGEWEDRRKRRRRQTSSYLAGHTHDTLKGKLNCEPGAMIHLLNVTVGFSKGHSCHEVYPGCQAGSAKATQVLHCQGSTGSCDIAIHRNFLARCGETANFALVSYECVPVAKRLSVCSKTDTDVIGGVVVTSPDYPSVTVGQTTGSGAIVPCECTLRAEAGTRFEMEYLRTHMPGSVGHCDGDLLLLERPDNKGKYVMEQELCGVNVSNHVVINDNILRVTFIGGAPLADGKPGFFAKFRAVSTASASSVFHISCEGTPPGDGAGKRAGAATARSNGQATVNRTREEQISHAKAQRFGELDLSFGPPAEEKVESDGGQATSPGVLSGVVASLASVIVIMGSLGAYIVHKKRQRRRREKEELERYGTISSKSELYYEGGELTKTELSKDSTTVRKPQRPLPDPLAKENSRQMLSKWLNAGRAMLGARSDVEVKARPCSVHSVASSGYESEPGTIRTAPQRIQQTRSQSPQSNGSNQSSSLDVSLPVAPPRHKKTHRPSDDDDADCPYDNADAGTLKGDGALGQLAASLNSKCIHVENRDDLCKDDEDAAIPDKEDNYQTLVDVEEENYSSISDIQAEVLSLRELRSQ
ncbi:unnamed protein product [Lymnaea stagnalis]|uniref:CUB domain-containing protein n=1 Tax=Lymnaea stagnalis TaxID=6523 RepID=A0AAV2HIL4_LYMST